MKTQLGGIVPPMTIPFNDKEDVDYRLIRQQARWLADHRVHGIVAGGSAGEGHTLTADELQNTLATVVEEVGDELPVVGGIIVNSTREAIIRGRLAKAAGVVALQVTPVHYIFRPDDDAMLEHFRAIADETGLPIILYNVVPWCYISPEQLIRIMHEVPGVIGVKQSAGDLKLMADLVEQAPPGKLIFSAVDALLYSSFTLGAHGAIAAMLAAVPGEIMRLWNAVQEGDHRTGLALHRKLLPLWNAVVGHNLPACVKYAQEAQGCPAGQSRAPMSPATIAQRQAIDAALAGIQELDAELAVAAAEVELGRQ